MRISLKVILLLIIFIYISGISSALEFKSVKGITESDLYVITNISSGKDLYFAGSDNTLLRKEDNGLWHKVYTVKGYRTSINYIHIDAENPRYVYVATGAGLLRSKDYGKTFVKIFKGQDSKESVVHHIRTKGNKIYVGTAQGLLVSKKDNMRWTKVKSLPNDIEIYWIEMDPHNPKITYIATSLGVYKTENNFSKIKKIFSTPSIDIPESEDELLVEETDDYQFLPKVIHVDNKYPDRIYLGTSDGLFISNIKDKSWHRISSSNLGRIFIKDIYQNKKKNDILYVATEKGFFKIDLKSDKITQFYKGLTTNDIRFISVSFDNEFLLATNKGLFKSFSNHKFDDVFQNYKEHFENEPTINEVQKAAIKYNDISSAKVQRWRDIAKKKAWLPEVSLGADRNVTDLYYWDTTTETGSDAILRKGDEAIEWDVSFSWDLGDLLWSGDQTTIDVRSRLNTQLRVDILEEVNRLYFERYRLKLQLLNSSIKNPEERLQKQLRLKEMTARLDSYTGGFFSRKCRELKMANRK